MRLELQAEKEELLHKSTLEKEEIVAKYEAEKQETQEELEAICQVSIANHFTTDTTRVWKPLLAASVAMQSICKSTQHVF